MKKHFIISLMSLALIASATTAAASTSPKDITASTYRMPAYRVETDRQTAAEKSLDRSLAEFSATARKPMTVRITPSLPFEQAQASVTPQVVTNANRPALAVRS